MPRFLLQAVMAAIVIVSGTARPAHAQGARGLPDPISSSKLVDLLAGLDEADLELVAVPIETYHAAFRELRAGPIERWLAERRDRSGGIFGSGDASSVADEVDARTALANRIAALDDRLFSDLEGVGIDGETVRLARDTRSRDRSRTLAGGRYTRGLRFEPNEIYATVQAEVVMSPQWALDGAVRRILEDHDRVRTTKLAGLAKAAMQVPVARAELLAALDLGMPDPEAEGVTTEDFERWFAARRDAERAAAEEVRGLQAALIAADRQALEQVLEWTGGETEFATAFRDAWLAEAHAGLFPDRESPASLFDAARAMHADGELDDETLEVVESIEASWRPRHRAVEDRMLRALEESVEEGSRRGLSLFGGVEVGSVNDSGNGSTALDEARQARADLDRETRTRLGEIAPERLASRVKEGDAPAFSFGGEGVEGEVGFSIAVVAGDPAMAEGEPIAIELGDIMTDVDFGDAAVFVSSAIGGPMGAPGNGLARPMDAEFFDRLCRRLEIDETTRPIVSALFADYRDGWAEIDATLVAEWNELPRGGFGPQGPIAVEEDDLARAASLRLAVLDAVLALDRTLFSDLGVLASEVVAAREAATRRRTVCIDAARGIDFGMPGGHPMATVDLVKLAEGDLDAPRVLVIGDLLDEWSRTQTPRLEERARSLIELDRAIAVEQQGLDDAFRSQSDGSGAAILTDSTEVVSMMERMRAMQKQRSTINRSLEDANESWTRRITASLAEVDPGSADAFRLAVDRTAWPRCFQDTRSPRRNFDRALALEDLDDGTRIAVKTLQGEWLASWTTACRELVAIERDGPRMDPFGDPTGFDPVAMQKAQSEKRRIRFDRNELNEKAIRELRSLLSPEQQEIVGELPEERRRMLPPGLGDLEMIIGG